MRSDDAPAGREDAERIPFAPRIDRWMVAVVGIALTAILVTAVAPLFDPTASGRDLALTVGTSLLVIAVTAALTVPLRYAMTLDALHVQAGLIRHRMPLAEVVRVETYASPLASRTAAWTARRIRITAQGGRTLDVGPDDRTGFMAELLARAPHLQERVVGGRRLWIDPARS